MLKKQEPHILPLVSAKYEKSFKKKKLEIRLIGHNSQDILSSPL
jgi:hypothetical protein